MPRNDSKTPVHTGRVAATRRSAPGRRPAENRRPTRKPGTIQAATGGRRDPAAGRLIGLLADLANVPSPSGFTGDLVEQLARRLRADGFRPTVTAKGSLLVAGHPAPRLVVSGHLDTLGAMVKGINADGTLSFTNLGGPVWPSFDGEYVTVVTAGGRRWRGTVLLNNPAAHVNREAGTTERKPEKMHVRLDALARDAAAVEALGVGIGDFICFDSRFEHTDTGFVKARFLDDKAGSAAMLDALLTLGPRELARRPVAFFFSVFEEVGHGACAGLPPTADRMLVIDMGVVGEGVTGREDAVSICVKDSSGPYDLAMRTRLVELAKREKIPYQLDVFPFYGSDGSAALAAGFDGRVALIGPGVSASHGMERTHELGLLATRDLMLAFIRAAAVNR